MKKLILVTLLFTQVLNSINAQKPNLEYRLFELPNVIFHKVDSSMNGITYELKIRQALDHSDSSKGFFYQKAFLLHKGFDRPTVMNTAGYDRKEPLIFELTKLLTANQIDIEHRYFGDSKPDTLDYNYLNFEQATGDLHYINQLLKNIYSGKWVSTGISKGGTTTIMYRYFYPNDVDVSVPYVAPVNNAFEDKRIFQFLDTVGTDECRSKMRSFQRRILSNRDKILPMFYFYAKGKDLDFTYNTLEEAFEYTVLEYSFSFWQFGNDCKNIPSDSTSLITSVENLLEVSDIYSFSDEGIDFYGPYHYQAATEMGAYGYETEYFKDLLQALPVKPNPSFNFVPNHLLVKFNGKLLNRVSEWLKTSSNHFIYINGNSDPWRAAAVPPSKKVDAKWFFLDGKNHRDARIANMNDNEKEEIISTLGKWLSLKIEYTLSSE